ncbi:DUF4160 domain-containing protein [Phyllobacterium sp. LjRoot231]|uniref:DUF4160 domain-containing protein n=1 Tax=Phyllobacterium sp. LjRoot231 TaxID=3342289 RepID=UPI003ECCA765
MPVIFRHKGFKFFFYANEGNPREPMHVHIEKDNIEAKFWLFPNVHLAYNDGFNAKTLRELNELVEQRHKVITGAWHEFFGES